MTALVCHNSEHLFRQCWLTLASSFEVPHVYIVGEQIKGMVSYTENPAKGTIVCLGYFDEFPNAQSLDDYEHPEDAVYVFGPDDDEKGWEKNFPTTHVVYIPTPGNTQLFSHEAAAIVLNDRRVKGWQ
jgi:hypothetical protein